MSNTKFWPLLKEAWGTSTIALESSPVLPDVTEKQIWEAIQRASEEHLNGTTRVQVVYALGEGAKIEHPQWILPSQTDADLDSYLLRVDKRSNGLPWSCAFSGLHRLSMPLWDQAAYFAREVKDKIGSTPIGRTDVDIFIGRYNATNVGIHQDFAHNLSFTIRGPKRLVTWPPQDTDKLPIHSTHYREQRKFAEILTGVAGGFTYFPPDQFHIGESPELPSAALNVVFFELAENPIQEALIAIQSSTTSNLARRTDLDLSVEKGSGDGATCNRHNLQEVFKTIQDLIADGSAQRISTARWLRSLTSHRMDCARPLEGEPMTSAGVLRLHSAAHLRYTQDPTDETTILYACDGNVDAATSTPELRKTLDLLGAGEALSIGYLTPEAAHVANKLEQWGCLEFQL